MQHQPHEPSEWDWRLKMKERATPVWLALASENPGVIFKTPASGGREKIKVQTFQFGNAAWTMSLPRRLRRCTCLIIQLLAEHVLPIYSSRSSAHGYIPPAAHPSGLLALRVCLFHIWIFTAMPLWELHSATARGNIWSRGHNPVDQSFVQSAICCRSVVNEESVGKERKGHQCEYKRLVAKDKHGRKTKFLFFQS